MAIIVDSALLSKLQADDAVAQLTAQHVSTFQPARPWAAEKITKFLTKLKAQAPKPSSLAGESNARP